MVGGGFDHVSSMALDWITKNIYWTDSGLHRIEVISAVGRFHAALITENITAPTCVVLDPRLGYVVKVKVRYSAYACNISKGLRYSTHCQGITPFCTPCVSSANGMSHTWLCLNRSWYSFTDPVGMEG